MKRALAAVLVFLLTTIVIFVTGFVGGTAWKSCWQEPGVQCSRIDPITGICACSANQHYDTASSKCVCDSGYKVDPNNSANCITK
jgi:hypothetical protein